MYLTISELETRAYLAGNSVLSDALARIVELELEVQALEDRINDLEDDSLTHWDRMNGPAKDYYDFFHECFERLGAHYHCPSVTSDYDKSIIFNAIDRGEGVTE